MDLFEGNASPGQVLSNKLTKAFELYFLSTTDSNILISAHEKLSKDITSKHQSIGRLLLAVQSKISTVMDRRATEIEQLQKHYSETMEKVRKNVQQHTDPQSSNKRRSKSCQAKK